MADTYGLTLTDVLRHHERQAAHAADRARHPLCKYETRMAWEADRDLHLMLAAVLRDSICRILDGSPVPLPGGRP